MVFEAGLPVLAPGEGEAAGLVAGAGLGAGSLGAGAGLGFSSTGAAFFSGAFAFSSATTGFSPP